MQLCFAFLWSNNNKGYHQTVQTSEDVEMAQVISNVYVS